MSILESTQFDLFGAACDVEESPGKPEAKVTRRRTVIQQPMAKTPVAVASAPDERHDGWTNSATCQAGFYIANDERALAKVRALIDDAGIIDHKKMARLFRVSRTTEQDSERDDYAAGLEGDCITLDYWARGEINWREIAELLTQDDRREIGLKTVDESVLAALRTATVEGNVIKLTSGQLPRPVYTKVDRVLRILGGKWNRKVGGHEFDDDPTDAFDLLLSTGKVEQIDDLGVFYTPAALADEVIALADLQPGETLIEPSAGGGALLERAAKIVGAENCVAVEIRADAAGALRNQGFKVETGDFLSRDDWHPAGLVDKVVANPPFAKRADIAHVLHAYNLLAPGGRLVAIMSAGVAFRQDSKAQAFRELVEANGSLKRNPPGSFKASGTSVETVLVVLNRPA